MSTKIKLDYPITCPARGELTELVMRRSKVRDNIAAHDEGGGPARIEVRLFSFLTGVSMEVLETMDEADYAKLQDAYVGFRRPAAAPQKSSGASSSGSAA